MKYFIRLHWWRQCHAMPGESACLTIAEDPGVYLERQRARLGDYWTDIEIDSCCPVSLDAEASPDPDLGYKSPVKVDWQWVAEEFTLGVLGAASAFIVIATFVRGLIMMCQAFGVL